MKKIIYDQDVIENSQIIANAEQPVFDNARLNHSSDRRRFLNIGAGALGLAALKVSAFGGVSGLLTSGNAGAQAPKPYRKRFTYRSDIYKVYEYNKDRVPPGATAALCQDELLRKTYVYLMNQGQNDPNIGRILNGYSRASYTFHINYSSWYCEPLTYVALASLKWKKGGNPKLSSRVQDSLKHATFHNFALMHGIFEFFNKHVIGWERGSSAATEKWLVYNLFACAEEKTEYGKIKGDEYLKADFEERQTMIEGLSNTFSSMQWTDADKDVGDGRNPDYYRADTNWYRLLSAQWGAFFLTCHYRLSHPKSNELTLIGDSTNQIEKEIRKKIGKVRGPPFYVGQDINSTYLL